LKSTSNLRLFNSIAMDTEPVEVVTEPVEVVTEPVEVVTEPVEVSGWTGSQPNLTLFSRSERSNALYCALPKEKTS
jgi:hypothetical protein